MILLDTNVISGMAGPDTAVATWVSSQAPDGLWISAMSVMEITAGLQRLPHGRRRDALAARMDALLDAWSSRIVVIDARVAGIAGAAFAARLTAGRPMSVADAHIAASALAVGATLATRNIKDFDGLGLAVVDPWAA